MPSNTDLAAGKRSAGMLDVASSLLTSSDCCIALLGVHLPCHHVLSLLVLNPWPRARIDLDSRGSRFGSLHVPHRLVGCLYSHGAGD